MEKESRIFLGPLEGAAKFFRRMLEAGVGLGALMRVVNHDDVLARAAAYIKAGCPEVVYDDNGMATADLQANRELEEFFERRKGLWVELDLKRFIDFGQQQGAQLNELEYVDLEHQGNWAEIFGIPGTPEHEESLRTAVTLVQIQQKVSNQWGRTPGDLLTDGHENLFAVIGKNYEPCVVCVRWHNAHGGWHVSCRLNDWNHVWPQGCRIFRNP